MKNFFLLVSIIAIVSCSAKKDFSKVKSGMKKAQVTSAVGEPDQKLTIDANITHWRYNDKEQHIVVFEDDTVSNVTDAKGAEDVMNAF